MYLDLMNMKRWWDCEMVNCEGSVLGGIYSKCE